MIDYHKELSYFKNTDSTHIQCDIDLVKSSEKVVQLGPEAGIAHNTNPNRPYAAEDNFEYCQQAKKKF